MRSHCRCARFGRGGPGGHVHVVLRRPDQDVVVPAAHMKGRNRRIEQLLLVRLFLPVVVERRMIEPILPRGDMSAERFVHVAERKRSIRRHEVDVARVLKRLPRDVGKPGDGRRVVRSVLDRKVPRRIRWSHDGHHRRQVRIAESRGVHLGPPEIGAAGGSDLAIRPGRGAAPGLRVVSVQGFVHERIELTLRFASSADVLNHVDVSVRRPEESLLRVRGARVVIRSAHEDHGEPPGRVGSEDVGGKIARRRASSPAGRTRS